MAAAGVSWIGKDAQDTPRLDGWWLERTGAAGHHDGDQQSCGANRPAPRRKKGAVTPVRDHEGCSDGCAGDASSSGAQAASQACLEKGVAALTAAERDVRWPGHARAAGRDSLPAGQDRPLRAAGEAYASSRPGGARAGRAGWTAVRGQSRAH
jgi:hypothetical protein